MIDISDGLSTDLGHICDESGVGAEVHAPGIPRARIGKPARQVELQFALNGGDDYELLFTARPGRQIPARIAGVPIRQIGQIIRGRRVVLVNEDGANSALKPRGWEHFKPGT
jgi:thiamine-monophosphate kinase